MFHVYYRSAERRSKASKSRPLTFVFNGGPGAASAYLHVGAVGPKRAVFGKNGTPPPPPSNLVDNQESWLQFSDLVFIDPIGTGFSRSVAESANAHEPKPLEDKDASKKEQQRREYYQVQEDLRSLGEFITKFLSTHGLWGRPVFIAGESYGGFRVAKLSRILQEQYGVAIHGAILISPALELNSLNGSPYDVYPWLDLIPSYAAAATFHGKSSAFDRRQAFGAIIASAEKFAVDRVSELYLKGDEVAARTQSEVLKTLASYVGLSEQVVKLVHGQITIATFQRELLRDRGELIGLYDASTALIDPFPHNAVQWFGDPTMAAFNRVYTTAINAQLRQEVGLVTNRDYLLLSGEVNQHWKLDDRFHAFHLGRLGG
jgi:carboxypeptidase C (cathepsin A)